MENNANRQELGPPVKNTAQQDHSSRPDRNRRESIASESTAPKDESLEIGVSRRDTATHTLATLGVGAPASRIQTDGPPREAALGTALTGTAFKWVDTMLNLMGIPTKLGTPPNQAPAELVLILQGYVTANDGGGGIFVWDKLSTDGDNAGTIIKPNDRTAISAGRWKRLYQGALNAKWFGAQGDNVNTDNVSINLALKAAAILGQGMSGQVGGAVYLPPGVYRLTDAIDIKGTNVCLCGDGPASRLAPSVASFDTIRINPDAVQGNPTISQRGNCIKDFAILDDVKTGGRSIVAMNVGDLIISGISISRPYSGIHLSSFNNVVVERVRVAGPRALDGWGFCCLLGSGPGGDPPRSDVIDFIDVSFGGDPAATDVVRHGLIVDGGVNTISAHKIYFIHLNGYGVWFRNESFQPLHDPEFASFYGMESDFCALEAIRIERGTHLHFTDSQIHGGKTTHNVYIGPSAKTVSFRGGFCTGASHAGFDIHGKQISVAGMDIYGNSGESIGTWQGIIVNSACKMISILGNKIGDPDANTQRHGIKVFLGADQFSITGNVIFNNVSSGIDYPPSRYGSTRIASGNAM